MSRAWLVGLLTAGLIAGVPTAVAALTDDQTPAAKQAAQGEADDGEDEGLGPPPWAHDTKAKAKVQGADKAWKQGWHALTPAQRRQKMTALVQAHADGMATWQQCLTTAGEDREERAACEKPLPPGLAKRQP